MGTPHVEHSSPAVDPFLVLILDDDEPITETLAYVVADEGYTPQVALQGRRALELMDEAWPALVFTDYMMPQMNGAQFIAALRAMAASYGLAPPPCILMTAAGVRPAQAAEADEILPKPFDLERIHTLLHQYLPPPPAQE
jgi:CheY-like chemotaxis protein